MSKIKNFVIIILSILTLFSAKLAAAAIPEPTPLPTPTPNCILTTFPPVLTVPTANDNLPVNQEIRFIIRVDKGFKYDVYLQKSTFGRGEVSEKNLTPNDFSDITFTKTPVGGMGIWKVGRHPIEVIRQGAPGNYCPNLAYEIKLRPQTEQVNCTILGPTEANIETEIKLSGSISPNRKYRFSIPSVKNTNKIVTSSDTFFSPDASGNIPEQNLGILNEGTYAIVLQTQIEVYDPNIQNFINTWQNVTSCRIGAIVVSSKQDKPTPNTSPTPIGSGQPGGGAGAPAVDICKIDPTKCAAAKGIPCGNDPTNPGIATAIGCIHTSPIGFIKDFLKFIIGLSGGVAFLLMLLGAFQMITSAGNPETLQAGRDRFQSAIIGLLFVIFAVLLLQIIGVDILDLGKQFGGP